MLSVERLRCTRLLLLLVLASAAVTSAQEPTLVRLRDAVGDTLDLAERDSLHLFPNTNGFRHAVILAIPGPEFFARVSLAVGDTAVPVYYRIQPGQLERIRVLIDNHGAGIRPDSSAAQALAVFWQEIEGRPLGNINGEPAAPRDTARASVKAATAGELQREPAVARDTPRAPVGMAATAGPGVEPATSENRYNCTLHGTACGSAIGGAVASWAGLTYSHSVPGSTCSPGYDVFRIEPCVYYGAAVGMTAAGCGAGYSLGNSLDRKAVASPPLPGEGKGWRTGCTIGAVVPGLWLGASFFLLAGGLHYGRTGFFYTLENDEGGWSYLPMALTSLCITVEIATIGYHIGRKIDRDNALKAQKKRQPAGR